MNGSRKLLARDQEDRGTGGRHDEISIRSRGRPHSHAFG